MKSVMQGLMPNSSKIFYIRNRQLALLSAWSSDPSEVIINTKQQRKRYSTPPQYCYNPIAISQVEVTKSEMAQTITVEF